MTVSASVPVRVPAPKTAAAPSLSVLAWRRFRHHRLALLGAALLGTIVGVCVVAPLMVPESAANRVDPTLFRAPPSIEHPFGNGRDHLDFTTRAFMPAWSAVAHPDVIEHRFLRGGLRLLIARQDWQNDRLARQTLGVASVQGRAEVSDLIEIAKAFGCKSGIWIRAVQIAAQAEAGLQLRAAGRAQRCGPGDRSVSAK